LNHLQGAVITFSDKIKTMKESINVWGIKEYEGDGISCPVIPAHLPFYKKLVLFFFRFGICPLCVTLSLAYTTGKVLKRVIARFTIAR
jgi:hypothetical protein